MEVFEAIRTVLAVRTYRDKPVPTAQVHRIVEAGRLSASASNKQPWHFVVVEDRATLRTVGEIMRTGPYTAESSFAIVVLIENENVLGVSDGSRAIQNMILTAWAEGIGSNWVGFGPLPKIEALLEVPKTHHALAVVPFGYADRKLGRGRKKRKPLGEVASRERYGTPFA